MRSVLPARLPPAIRPLALGVSVAALGALAACSNDAIRFEEALTTSATMTPNQHAIIHGNSAARDVARTGVKVVREATPQPVAATSVLPSAATVARSTVTRSSLPSVPSVPAAAMAAPVVAAAAARAPSYTAPTATAARVAQARASVASVKVPQPDRPAPGIRTRTVNGQTVPILQPLPTDGITTSSVPTSPPTTNSATASAPPAKPAGKGWQSNEGRGGRVTVKPGETLYNLSRRYGVPVKAIQKANGLTDTTVQAGQTILIPRFAYGAAAPVSAPDNDPHTRVARSSTGYQGQARGKVTTPKKRAAYRSPVESASRDEVDERMTGSVPKLDPVQTRATPRPSAAVAAAKPQPTRTASAGAGFRWPVQGRILSKFGERTRVGTNDGIDIAAAEGTPVRATRAGTVIYSGAELEDFGRLILVSHTGGWVSAYAHNSATLVKRGQKVAAGQVIAKAGSTGNTNVPKLHFELRKDSTPVNPLSHLTR